MAQRFTKEYDEVTFKNKTLSKNKESLNISQGDVKAYFVSKSRKFAGGGAFIPCPTNFKDKWVCVIVLEKKPK